MSSEFLLNIIIGFIGLIGVSYGIWQNRKATHIKKAVNDKVKGLYKDSQQIISMAKNKTISYGEIAERGRKIKENIIQLDITNKNLNFEDIDKLKDKGILSPAEAEEYKRLSSS